MKLPEKDLYSSMSRSRNSKTSLIASFLSYERGSRLTEPPIFWACGEAPCRLLHALPRHAVMLMSAKAKPPFRKQFPFDVGIVSGTTGAPPVDLPKWMEAEEREPHPSPKAETPLAENLAWWAYIKNTIAPIFFFLSAVIASCGLPWSLENQRRSFTGVRAQEPGMLAWQGTLARRQHQLKIRTVMVRGSTWPAFTPARHPTGRAGLPAAAAPTAAAGKGQAG